MSEKRKAASSAKGERRRDKGEPRRKFAGALKAVRATVSPANITGRSYLFDIYSNEGFVHEIRLNGDILGILRPGDAIGFLLLPPTGTSSSSSFLHRCNRQTCSQSAFTLLSFTLRFF